MSEELKPCPFCGGPAETSRGLHNYDMWGIWCPDCKISVCALYPSEQDAIDAWNRRAERTCRMVDCGSHDTCVVNSELSDGNIMSMEFGYRQCSDCGAFVFDCPTVHYCPICGARVEVE